MILVDANLLIYAADDTSPQHERAADWLTSELNGDRPVGLPWESLIAFVRISTDPRIAGRPTSVEQAWRIVETWLAATPAWIPQPTERHADVLGTLLKRYRLGAKLVPDVHLAAIAVEHGLELCSADTDFARFTEVRWTNPLAE